MAHPSFIAIKRLRLAFILIIPIICRDTKRNNTKNRPSALSANRQVQIRSANTIFDCTKKGKALSDFPF